MMKCVCSCIMINRVCVCIMTKLSAGVPHCGQTAPSSHPVLTTP